MRECTDWKSWERLSTLVEYVNLGDESSNAAFDGNIVAVDEIRPPADRHDIAIWSAPFGQQTCINLWYCQSILQERLAQQMLDRLKHHIASFKDDLHGLISLDRPEKDKLPSIPMPLYDDIHLDNVRRHQRTDSAVSILTDKQTDLHAIIDQVWLNVLSCQQADLLGYWQEKTPFFEAWVNLIAALALARWYTDAGFDVSMEDVLEDADMAAQVGMLDTIRRSVA